ncbi:hypothetical protein [Microbacterium sp.]|uniref:hypothetical protein n=1 Tax=Microbacterium sp. TaxID=51671 RepID=UPI0037367E07
MNRVRPRLADDDRGAALITVIIVALVLGLLTVTLSTAVVNTTRTAAGVRGSLQAQSAADAGIAAAVAELKSGDICAATVAGDDIPGSGGGASYAVTVACTGDTVTVTSTGIANGSSTTVQAVYGIEPEIIEQVDPSLTPVGLVIYEGSSMGQVTLLAHGGNEPQLVSVKGPFGCRLAVPGNLLVGGDVTSSDGCNITGDLYAAGNVTFDGGATTVTGDLLIAGTGTSKINSAIGVAGAPLSTVATNGALDLLWSGAAFHANASAKGAVTVNNRRIAGSVTLPTANTPAVGDGGRIEGGVIKSDTIAPVPAPTLPGWFDFRYKASDWPGAVEIVLKASGSGPGTCASFNSSPNQGWKDLASYTGTVVIDARACSVLSSNAGGYPSPALAATNVVLLAKQFNTTHLTMRSAPGAAPKVWFITEDTTADAAPTCPLASKGGSTATSFVINHSDFEGVRSLIYTPCRVDVQGGGVLLGAMYTNGFASGDQVTIKGEIMTLPGQTAPDGGYGGTPVIVETGEYRLGDLISRQDVTP